LSCVPGEILALLLPHLAGMVIEGGVEDGGRIRLLAAPAAREAACTGCGLLSSRLHGGYQRRLRDVPAGGRDVVIVLAARRFRCAGPDCPKVTFTEQPAGLASRFARRTPAARAALTAVAAALCGRPGARLAAELGFAAPSRHTMIRLVMALPEEEAAAPVALGVDDFALARGRAYGTVLIDMATGQVTDLLPDREAATLEAWLKAHPGAAVICRDRAGAYARGAAAGAPGAIQVADRWHLWHNLGEYAGKAAARHQDCLREPAAAGAGQGPEQAGDRETVIRERHRAVRALREAGTDLAGAAAALGLGRQVTSRYWHAPDAAALLAPARPAPGLDPFKPLLRQRWDQGCTNISALHKEITAAGYAGSYSTAYRYASLLSLAAPPAPPAPPAPRQAAGWIMTDPARLDPGDAAALAAICARCPELAALARHVTEFAKILTSLHGARLAAWLDDADTGPARTDLKSFTRGIRLDYQAVLNGLTLPWNSGKVEGTVNKIKLIKRQAYGRAGFPLLRKRVLHA
jgi:transposase